MPRRRQLRSHARRPAQLSSKREGNPRPPSAQTTPEGVLLGLRKYQAAFQGTIVLTCDGTLLWKTEERLARPNGGRRFPLGVRGWGLEVVHRQR